MGIMCFGSSKQDDPLVRRNAEIDRQIRMDQKQQAKEVKMLLLGMQPSFAFSIEGNLPVMKEGNIG